MRNPKRASERRESAMAPQPMNDQATIRLAATVNSGVLSWLLVNASVTPIALNTIPAAITPKPLRFIALSKHSFERSAGELSLGNEPARAALGNERPEVGSVAARGEH